MKNLMKMMQRPEIQRKREITVGAIGSRRWVMATLETLVGSAILVAAALEWAAMMLS